MNTTVQKWGNSLALRIPKAMADDVRLHQGSIVEIVVEDGKMIVKPNEPPKYSLTQMLEKITKSNIHSEIEWGDPVGREVW